MKTQHTMEPVIELDIVLHCSIKIKICDIWQNTFYKGGGGGGHSWGVIQNKFNVFGGLRKKMSQVGKIPPPPRDFINERSLNQSLPRCTEQLSTFTA